ncbi:MAG TPA: amidoligase family protein [Candidatus Saccharimonadales bacterium]|nr:amidoligase family protein [Candidatus Saccharimonadales bacterium]
MPSKGGRSTSEARTNSAAIAPAAGPAVAPRETTVVMMEAESIRAVMGAPVSGGAAPMAEEEPIAFVPILDDDPSTDTPEWADLYAQSVSRHRDERERIDREQSEAQGMWEAFLATQGAEVPEGERSLTTNDELHRQLLELARSSGGQYERENVIGDPNQTFGVEIEFDGADPTTVARALHAAGLSTSPSQRGYHAPRQPGEWVCERDSTVTGEIVSPVLRDTPETWRQLEQVCSILRDNGARVTARTGGHVHVGADSAGMDHDVGRFRRVANACAWAEDLMYRLAAASGRGGRRHRGAGNGYRWCGPMGTAQFEQAQSLGELASRVGASHGVGLNYGNILDGRRTIEYRYFDSSIDPARLQANIKLACWITKRASTLPDSAIPTERVRLGSHASGQVADTSDNLLRRFADTIFVRPQDKLKLYWLFQRSAWQPARRAA